MKKKLHILFLCGWFPSKVFSNNGDFIERHAKAVATKHFVTVLHIITDKNATKSIEIVSKKEANVTTHIAYLKKADHKLKKVSLFIKAFFALLKKVETVDVVHLNEIFPFGMFSLYLKWFQKKPYIISEHWTGYHPPQARNISFIQKLISRKVTKNAAFICPVSNDLKNSLEALNFEGNYNRVPNVVDTNLFYPEEQSSSTFKIIHVSNMVNEHKNVEGILRVIYKLQEKITNFKFTIIGENSKQYVDLANELKINPKHIIFKDQIPHVEVAQELRESNLFILFSNYENLPCVILESFSCGVPVISTNVGGINEFFPEDFGELIQPKDEIALLQNIVNFYTNFKVDKLKMHNYVVENFSEEKIATDFEKLYYKSLKK
ncbi:glycosyltransferase family 4 protein [Polaribacter cellanae]|uniref:Glycosyltransferase family 4 protein n=1 Tax=Polaribacter cellanae TaxID=2818493 RepID=A0A975HA79_9FLAO|nr:glycosyltransferase family 4 protein [Polaribacter cellanae]QTE23985.1 glycosyltransferase family 4 protein [Polaribacter cellanae]